MSNENIRLDEPAFCYGNGYFYTMKPAPTNMLLEKTQNGDPVMTYPFSHEVTVPDDEFLALQFDGVNFWSLEKRDMDGDTEKERILRRWRIENFICTLKDTWRVRPQGVEDMDGEAFVIENYYNYITEACGPGTSNLDRIKLKYPTAAFFHVTDQFHLKADSGEYSQDIPVATTPDESTVTIASPFQHVFYPGDRVYLRRGMYFFNNQAPAVGESSAAIYNFTVPYVTASDPTELRELTYRGCHESGMYEQTSAATFITTSGLSGINNGYYTGIIGYIRGMQMLLKQPNMPGGGLTYPGGYTGTNQEFKENISSMIIDNALKNNRIDIHTIYDMGVSVSESECITKNIFRLQTGFTYGALEGTWSTYNYVVSTMNPVVTSISLNAEPALVVANGVDRSILTATVKDQFGAPLNYKRVVFQISAPNETQEGYFVCPDHISTCVEGSFTWLDGVPHKEAEIITGSQSSYPGGPAAMQGQAIIEWRAGTSAGLVTIVATVQP